MMDLIIRRMEKEDHKNVSSFDCGDKDINSYLHRVAWKNQEKHLYGVTTIAALSQSPPTIVGYYTLANSNIPLSVLAPESNHPGAGRLLKYRDVPALLVGRLGVAQSVAGQGVGTKLMAHAVQQALHCARNVSGCRCLIVEAYPAKKDWYARFGFIPVLGSAQDSKTIKMYMDLRTAQAAEELLAKDGSRADFSESQGRK